jgi:predicted DNA-binding transcriptional regulator AlpA
MFPMSAFSMRQAAKKLGLSVAALSRYVTAKKVPAPEPERIGGLLIYAWSDEDIERVRKILPKIVNGRKTRHKKKASKTGKNKKQ